MKTNDDGLTRFYPHLHGLFSYAWDKHLNRHRLNGDYQVCTNLLCRICWWLENWLWYAGRAY